MPYRVENCRVRDAAFLRQRRLSDSGTGGRERGKCKQANRERRFHVLSPLLSALKPVADAYGPDTSLTSIRGYDESLGRFLVCGALEGPNLGYLPLAQNSYVDGPCLR